MGSQSTAPSDTLETGGGGHPRWVMLQHRGGGEVAADSCFSKTVAASRTSTGHPIRVSFVPAAPPAVSRLCCDSTTTSDVEVDLEVIAAHGDSVLVQITSRLLCPSRCPSMDHFVYKAAAAAAELPRPPSLSMLPPYWLPEEGLKFYRNEGLKKRRLTNGSTGMLRRGEDELVVADLKEILDTTPKAAEILLLRSGEWIVKRAPISYNDGKRHELASWKPHTVVPVGDRLLCWVDLLHGIIFSDVFDESPRMWHVSLPVEDRGGGRSGRSVCVTDGGAALKFVDIFRRCCCGSPATTSCAHSRHAFVITTWTLRIDGDMAWTMDAMVDATELWALDTYHDSGLPRVPPGCAAVSMDDPHLISFIFCELGHVKPNYANQTVWLAMVDMRSKTIRSVSRYPDGMLHMLGQILVLSRISSYLNNPHRSGNNGGTGKPVIVDDATNSLPQISCKSPSDDQPLQVSSSKVVGCNPKELFMALALIQPGLAQEDLLKAYSILARDNGRLFTFLFGVPVSLRKDWLLMEIKNSQVFTCSVCSTCKGDLQHVQS